MNRYLLFFLIRSLNVVAGVNISHNDVPVAVNGDTVRNLLDHSSTVVAAAAAAASAGIQDEGRRRLEGGYDGYGSYYDDLSFLGDYSLKFIGCWHKSEWNPDTYLYPFSPKVVTKRYVKFRLCPKSSCDDDKSEGCKTNYGDYVTDLDTFMDAYMVKAIENKKYAKKFRKRATIANCRKILGSCGCNRAFDDDWFEWDDCFQDCFPEGDEKYEVCTTYKDRLEPTEQAQDANDGNDGYYAEYDDQAAVKQNEYDDQYFMDDLYDDDAEEEDENNQSSEEAFLYRYSRCRVFLHDGQPVNDDFDDATNYDDISYDDDSAASYPYLYLGPFCANSGNDVFIGMFTDRTCSNYADKSGGRNTYYRKTGESLPFSRDSLVDRRCVECEAYDDSYYDDDVITSSVCSSLYQPAGKCETKLDAGKGTNVENSCNYLNNIKVRKVSIFDKVNTDDAVTISMFVFMCSTILIGLYTLFLRWLLARVNYENPSAIYYYD